MLREALVRSIEKNIRKDMSPPYIGPLPGVKQTFLESIGHDRPSVQGWPHRVYSELLQADVLPPDLACAGCCCSKTRMTIACTSPRGSARLACLGQRNKHRKGADTLGTRQLQDAAPYSRSRCLSTGATGEGRFASRIARQVQVTRIEPSAQCDREWACRNDWWPPRRCRYYFN
jgi:hypothetical protein